MSSRKRNFNVQTWVPIHEFANVVYFLESTGIYKGSSSSEILRILIASVSKEHETFPQDATDTVVDYLSSKGFRLSQIVEPRGRALATGIVNGILSKNENSSAISARAKAVSDLMEEE